MSSATYTSNIMKKSSYKNDAFLHNISANNNNANSDQQVNILKPEKYINKTRNLKPITHDYRSLLISSNTSLHKSPSLNVTQKKIFPDTTTDDNRSPLFQRLNSVGNEQNINTLQTPLKQKRSITSYQNTTDYKQMQNQKLDNTKNCVHGNVIKDYGNNLQQGDIQLIKNVQGVLKKKEKNHHDIYKMLDDQRQVVSKLVKKYKRRAVQEEKLLTQKMRELEKCKDNYLNMKKNEDMLQNLQVQIGIRLKDYKQNQDSINNDIATNQFLSNQQYQQATRKFYQVPSINPSIQQDQDCNQYRCKQSKSVHSRNMKRWNDYGYKDQNIKKTYNQRPVSQKTKIKYNKLPDFQF